MHPAALFGRSCPAKVAAPAKDERRYDGMKPSSALRAAGVAEETHFDEKCMIEMSDDASHRDHRTRQSRIWIAFRTASNFARLCATEIKAMNSDPDLVPHTTPRLKAI